MNLLDWLLIVLVLAYALSGYWQGFVTGAFATAGLLLGGLFGVWLAPIALGDADPSLWCLAGRAVHRDPGGLAGPGRAASSPAPGSATGSRGSRSAPSTPSGARCSVRSPCCSSPGRSASRSPARGSAGSPRMVRDSTVLAAVNSVLPGQAQRRPARLQQRRRHGLLPALPRAVRARAHRRGRPGPTAAARGPRHARTPRPACSRSAAPTSAATGSRAPASSTPPTG